MKIFVDTANVDEIRKVNDMGVICGVTTNPSLIAKEGRDFVEVVKEMLLQAREDCLVLLPALRRIDLSRFR